MHRPGSIESPNYFARFHSFSPASDWNHTFQQPAQVRTGDLTEVRPVIDFADAASRAGNWVVLILAYEAAPALDPVLQVHPPRHPGQPVVWAAVFQPDQVGKNQPQWRSGPAANYHCADWQPAISRARYQRAIKKIHAYIRAGHTYQVNFTYGLDSTFQGNAEAWFDQLCLAQQADFCAFIKLPDRMVLSLSPELFFQRQGNLLTARPMKGTIGRGRFPDEDRRQRDRLAGCPKNQAENVMITDLIRNDLGRIAMVDSVTVPRLFSLEQFKTVWQMTSTVQARIPETMSLGTILENLFPCGSITGAPKVRTMEIIRELETEPRGIYTGAIGFLRPGGDCIFNVPIRTVVIDQGSGHAHFGVGGGITTDSTPDGEFDECRLKAAFLRTPLEPFSLLESIRLENGQWFLAERHLQRIQDSAGYFKFRFTRESLQSALQAVRKAHPGGLWKVRLLLDSNGAIKTEAACLPPVSPESPLRLQLARSPVDSRDPLLFHKITNRAVYEKARSQCPQADEVILWNRKKELTEGCIHNLVIEKDGRKWTPPVSCGLLAGTFRQELLLTGQLEERILDYDDLLQADAIWLINSVRKWRSAVLTRPADNHPMFRDHSLQQSRYSP